MLFCPECSSLMKPKKTASKKSMVCSCGYSTNEVKNAVIKEEIVDNNKKVEVVDKDFETLPLVDAECPKCKHGKAYFWDIQTRASDEPATKFYKCEKCKHIWRDYS